MAVKYVRWGRALCALAVVWVQVTACGSSAKKSVAPGEDAGSDQGGASESGGKAATAGTAGKPHVGGAPSDAGSAGDDAGAAGASNGGSGGEAEIAGSSAMAGSAATAGNGGNAGAASAAPHIASFSGPASACAGSKIDLTYSYTGGLGTITPGDLAASLSGSVVQATLPAIDTTYTLTVTGAGDASATATAKVTSIASPVAAITTAATAVHGDTLVPASVPAQANVTYAWSVLSGTGAINGAANKNTVAFDVGATGTEIELQVVVTSTLNSCASTTDLHIPIPCAVPTLVSVDRATPPGPQYIPNNEETGHFDTTGSGNLWTAYLNNKSNAASYNGTFNRYSAGKWAVPSGSPAFLNDATTHLLYYKVATDAAGDAVFVWTQTSDNNNYQVMVAAYRASDSTWSTAQTVGTVFNQESPVQVKIDRATGVALITWPAGPFGSIIPHLRSYTVSTNALGADLALRPSTTNTFAGDGMALGLETNDSLTGFAAWYEKDSGTGLATLYALHITKGVPDTVASTYDIKALAVATATFTTDVFNFNSVHNVSASAEPRMVAVSASGNGAVVWGVFNGLATGTVHGQLYARRYTGGAWGAAELVASQGPGFSRQDWAIDDAGNVIAEVWTNNVGYDFFSGPTGSAWSAAQHLTATNGASALPNVALDSATGKGIATYRDGSLGVRAPLRGAFYDPTTHALSPAFTIDDPQQSGGEGGHVRIDGTGLATVFYTQMPKVLPNGANSSNSSLLFTTTCK